MMDSDYNALTSFQMSNGWRPSIEVINPARAEKLLESNTGNRSLRKSVTAKYTATMSSGNWLLSPEPICFGHNGLLLNGQHRLHAIIASGCTLPFFVVRNVDASVFEVLDRGLTRTVADAIGIHKKLAEVARLGAMIGTGAVQSSTIPDADVRNAAYILQEVHEELLRYCGSKAKIFSSAPFRLSACVRIMSFHNPSYVFDTYRALVLGRVSELPPIAQNAVGSVAAGRWENLAGGQRQYLDLARAWDLFDFHKAQNNRIVVHNTDRCVSEVRKILTVSLKAAGLHAEGDAA